MVRGNGSSLIYTSCAGPALPPGYLRGS